MISACIVAIVLLFDVSSSVDPIGYRLQRDGTAAAFRSEPVQKAITNSPGGVAVSVVEWGGRHEQTVTVPWRVLKDAEDAAETARLITATRRSPGTDTALGDAMAMAMAHLESVPCQPERRVIDVSGDGASNAGQHDPKAIRNLAAAEGIIVNGLPITTHDALLADYYREEVITAGGFVIEAADFADVGMALVRKLVQEIALQVSPLPPG